MNPHMNRRPSHRATLASILRMTILALLVPAASAASATVTEATPVHNATPLGTLFYSPAQRAAITQARAGSLVNQGSSGEADSDAIKSPPPILEINGVVRRGQGKSTVWINRRPVAEGQPIGAAGSPSIANRSVVIDGKAVRVGETINLATGQRSDIAPPAAVRVTGAK